MPRHALRDEGEAKDFSRAAGAAQGQDSPGMDVEVPSCNQTQGGPSCGAAQSRRECIGKRGWGIGRRFPHVRERVACAVSFPGGKIMVAIGYAPGGTGGRHGEGHRPAGWSPAPSGGQPEETPNQRFPLAGSRSGSS